MAAFLGTIIHRCVHNAMKHPTHSRPIQDQENRPIALVSDQNIKKSTHQALGVSLGMGTYLIIHNIFPFHSLPFFGYDFGIVFGILLSC